jgi:hypothetical protein
MADVSDISSLDIDLDRDVFLRNLIRELSGVLEEVVGIQEASGFISVVGRNIGGRSTMLTELPSTFPS